MIVITLDEEAEQINIPQSWNEIRLSEYEKWFDIVPSNRKEEVELIARICNIDPNLFFESPTRLFEIVMESMAFIFEEPAFESSNSLSIDGQQYYISFSDGLTLGEWVDVESVFDNNPESRLSEILSILCRPVGEDYDSRKSESRREMFANLTMDKALPLLAFFLQRNELSEKITGLYSQIKEHTDQYLRITQDFAENGDGIKSLPIWQRIKYYISMLYLKNRLSKYSASLSTASKKTMPRKNKINSSGK